MPRALMYIVCPVRNSVCDLRKKKQDNLFFKSTTMTNLLRESRRAQNGLFPCLARAVETSGCGHRRTHSCLASLVFAAKHPVRLQQRHGHVCTGNSTCFNLKKSVELTSLLSQTRSRSTEFHFNFVVYKTQRHLDVIIQSVTRICLQHKDGTFFSWLTLCSKWLKLNCAQLSVCFLKSPFIEERHMHSFSTLARFVRLKALSSRLVSVNFIAPAFSSFLACSKMTLCDKLNC